MANVLSLVPYKVFPAKLGGQKGIALFYNFFSKYHNVTWITVKDNDPSSADFKILNIFSGSKFRYINILYFFKIKKLIPKLHINHLIIEHPYFGWLGVLLKRSCNIKLIIHSHNIEAQRFKSLGKWWWSILWHYEKWVHSSADETFCKTAEDQHYMIDNYKINPGKCHIITYGIEWNQPPSISEKIKAKSILKSTYSLDPGTLLFLFNGTLNYGPNYQAVRSILDHINKELINKLYNYKIFICGKGLPESDNELKDYINENIIYAGFVDDINVFFKGVDIFINPVVDGGGIKTKLVEALASDLNAVSCVSGAIGVDEKLCNGKLHLNLDNDWHSFASKMMRANENTNHIGTEFFDHFYWGAIAKKAASFIEN